MRPQLAVCLLLGRVGGVSWRLQGTQDAVARPRGLKVPQGPYCYRLVQTVWLYTSRVLQSHTIFHIISGCYYLCDNGYANSSGFLTPYKGVRYHLREWGPGNATPENPREMFNMRHTKARNIIERAFAVLKMRWGILRSASFYPIKTQIRLIMPCFLLHNFIRLEMPIDPFEAALDGDSLVLAEDEQNIGLEYVDCVEPSAEWNQTRDDIAMHMWNSR